MLERQPSYLMANKMLRQQHCAKTKKKGDLIIKEDLSSEYNGTQKHLQKWQIHPEPQCHFRVRQSTLFLLTSQPGMYKVSQNIVCIPSLPKLIASFHEDMKTTLKFDEMTFDHSEIKIEIKHDRVITSTLIRMYIMAILNCAFRDIISELIQQFFRIVYTHFDSAQKYPSWTK